ncbi:MAG TPA: VOC family protein [Acidimicrobiales bacterium]|nr:VOC family protein [Acidimicrobiales bacterium]
MQLEVAIDCADPDRLAGFWCAALDYRPGPAAPPYVTLLPKSGAGIPVVLQAVPEPKRGKNRVHLDLYVEDHEAEAARLIALGASRIDLGVAETAGCHWIVLADPEGNEFCVCRRDEATTA